MQMLAGTRILDLSTGIAGSVAAMLLAEAGAEVIKVEPPHGSYEREPTSFAAWNDEMVLRCSHAQLVRTHINGFPGDHPLADTEPRDTLVMAASRIMAFQPGVVRERSSHSSGWQKCRKPRFGT